MYTHLQVNGERTSSFDLTLQNTRNVKDFYHLTKFILPTAPYLN